ncbi:DEAD/DEAH box helicase [Saccharomonospora halophila]|uniref:DEAD/DEAH box helicase n=1 Tax=Saccharomonospora halophila TaxID=129922 RepID=UPI0003697EBD|nr:DEAD/DEAH box helicase [Saccharomonospora halophila]
MSDTAGTREDVAAPEPADDATARPLRAWQRRALTKYLSRRPKDFLAVATPGAGKTVFGLRIAAELLSDRTVESVTIVTPTEHLKHQWAASAEEAGIPIDSNFTNGTGVTSPDYRGVAVTYAQVAAHPTLHRVRTENRKTLVILDEIHHAGDAKSWGDAIFEAFTPAVRRLGLTGTPFRSDDAQIPFVTYEPDADGALRSKADSAYNYADALADGVVRPVVFLAYSGETSWRTSAGDEFTARLGEPLTAEQTARAWRTALDPSGEWIPSVLQAADTRLTQLRSGGVPDAGGLVIATDHESAKAYATILARVSGEQPVVVLSDDPKATKRIGEFAESTDRWLVAVRMVSEGVDVPRLAVGVYATSASTPLFFAQVIGRFVRSRRPGETASVFLPSVPVLLELASELETERDHVLGKPDREKEGWDDELLVAANRTDDERGEEEKAFTSLGASAELDQVIYDGNSFGTATFSGSEEEQEYLGLPGLLDADQMRALLRKRQEEQLADAKRRKSGTGSSADAAGSGASGPESPGQTPAPRPQSVNERLKALRKELNTLVGLHHHRTRKPHGAIHNELRRVCGGPPTAMATAEQLEERIATLRSW